MSDFKIRICYRLSAWQLRSPRYIVYTLIQFSCDRLNPGPNKQCHANSQVKHLQAGIAAIICLVYVEIAFYFVCTKQTFGDIPRGQEEVSRI